MLEDDPHSHPRAKAAESLVGAPPSSLPVGVDSRHAVSPDDQLEVALPVSSGTQWDTFQRHAHDKQQSSKSRHPRLKTSILTHTVLELGLPMGTKINLPYWTRSLSVDEYGAQWVETRLHGEDVLGKWKDSPSRSATCQTPIKGRGLLRAANICRFILASVTHSVESSFKARLAMAEAASDWSSRRSSLKSSSKLSTTGEQAIAWERLKAHGFNNATATQTTRAKRWHRLAVEGEGGLGVTVLGHMRHWGSNCGDWRSSGA